MEKEKNEQLSKIIQELGSKNEKYKQKIETLIDYRNKADLEVS